MNEWTPKILGNLVTHKKGYAFKSKDFGIAGRRVIKVKDFTSNSIDISDCTFLDNTIADEYEQYALRTDDLIIATVGSWPSNPKSVVGKVVKVPSSASNALLNQNAVRLRPTDEITNAFLYYRLKTNEFADYLISGAQGSANQASITLDDLFSFSFPLPGLDEQNAIAAVLSSLDNKIDLFQRQNQTLESMAQTIFRQWFVEEAQDEWDEYQIKYFVTHKKQNIKPSDTPTETFIHYSLPAFDDGKNPVLEFGAEIKSNKYQVAPYSILVSKLNPRFPRIWSIYFEPEPNSICSTEFQVIKPNSNDYFGFIYYLLNSEEAVVELELAASGTSGSHQRVRPDDILNLSFALPSKDRAKEFSKLVEPSLQKKVSNRLQIRTLEKIRDTLLPKLMSGEARVQY